MNRRDLSDTGSCDRFITRGAANGEGITGNGLLEFINQELFPYLKGMPLKGSHPHRAQVAREVFADAYN